MQLNGFNLLAITAIKRRQDNHIGRIRHDQPIDQIGPLWPPIWSIKVQSRALRVMWPLQLSGNRLLSKQDTMLKHYGLLPTANRWPCWCVCGWVGSYSSVKMAEKCKLYEIHRMMCDTKYVLIKEHLQMN